MEKTKPIWLKPLIFVLGLGVLIAGARFAGLDSQLGSLREWIQGLGLMGPVIFSLLYALAAVLAIPGSALTIMAGALFGSIAGSLSVIIGATLGASLCFLISRYLARDALAKLLENNEKFKKLDDLTEKNGAIIVAITRLVPLFPFNLLNYGFGLTRIPFKTYVFWSFFCMMPGTILYVVGTDLITQAITEGRIPWPLVAVFILVFVLLFFLVKKARQNMRG